MVDIKKNSNIGYFLIGLLLLALGLVFIIFNDALKGLTITVGILLIAFSAVYLIITIAQKDRGPIFVIKTVFGAIGIICGTITAIFNKDAVGIVVSVFSLLLIVDASFKLNTAASLKKFGVKIWWLIMALSFLTIGVSFFILKYTPSSIVLMSIFLGIVLIIDSISNILFIFCIPALERRAKSAIYYEMYKKEFEKK